MKNSERTKPHGILVFGANASGKATLGRELARIVGYHYMRHQDYHFVETPVPYTVERPYEECLRLMLADMEKHGAFVLSAVTGDFGPFIPAMYELAVWITTPYEERMRRIDARAYAQHGERIRQGGDMYEGHQAFVQFAATRPLEKIDHWAATLTCPIVHVNGTADWRTNAARIAAIYREQHGSSKQ